MTKRAVVLSVVCAVGLVGPPPVMGDYWDEFGDGEYAQDPNNPDIFDPNLWDIDNPHWTIRDLITSYEYYSASTGALWLFADTYIPAFAWLDAQADDGDHDPNTSTAYFDNSGSHYMVAYVMVDPDFPNTGRANLRMYNDAVAHWTAYACDYVPSYQGGNARTAISSYNGVDRTDGPNEYRTDIDPNGFWMALQYDTNASVDPNNHSVRAAAWNGDKYDWDGQWDLSASLTCWWPDDLWTEGAYSVAVYGDANDSGIVSYMAFDNIECRWGTFTNTHRRLLDVVLKDCCELNLEPNLCYAGEPRRYTHGTVVCLDAVVPCGDKSFKKWTIKGPNDALDPNYQVVNDTNEVLYLTMDADYHVKATCKCGGGGMTPLLTMTLGVLGLLSLIRRRA